MQVRFLYLRYYFSKCPMLWRKLKKFATSVDLSLCKDLQIFEKTFSKLKSSEYVLKVNSVIDASKISLKILELNPSDQDLNKKQLNYIKVFRQLFLK